MFRFRVTRKILVLLLETLLLDDVARDYCELDYPLHQVLKVENLSFKNQAGKLHKFLTP